MKYFKNITTLEELRKEYRKLVKENHPDNGGSEEAIKAINVEYEYYFNILKNNDTKENENKYNMTEDEMLRNVINAIINLNIEIEICGSWIWVSGNTFGCKEELKRNNFKWASKKKMWYWHNPEQFVIARGKMNMEDIRIKYGSQVVKQKTEFVCIQ